MKKFSLLVLLSMLFMTVVNGQHSFSKSSLTPGSSSGNNQPLLAPSELQITHSTSQSIMSANSVSCNAGGLHANNSYFRVFDMPNDFSITSGFVVSRIEIGIEDAVGASGSQPVELRFYTLNGSFTLANLTPLYSETFSVPDQNLSIFSMVLTTPVIVPAGKTLVVEVFTPDGQGVGNRFFIGSNNLGEGSASYLAAGDCGVTEPTTIASIGFPNMQMVMNLYGVNAVVPIPYGYIASIFLLIAGALIIRRRFF